MPKGCRQCQSSTNGCSNERVDPSSASASGRYTETVATGSSCQVQHQCGQLPSEEGCHRRRNNEETCASTRARGRHRGDPRCGHEAHTGVTALDEQSGPTRIRSVIKADLASADDSKPAEANPPTCVPPLLILSHHTPSTGSRQMSHRVTCHMCSCGSVHSAQVAPFSEQQASSKVSRRVGNAIFMVAWPLSTSN